jgi:hypothetical protein
MKLAGGYTLQAIDRIIRFPQPRQYCARMSGKLRPGAGQIHSPAHLLEQR